MSTVLSARGLQKAFGAKTLFSELALSLSDGDRVGLLGVNGTGKSTLLKVLAGKEPYDAGVIERRRDASFAYLEQEPALDPTHTPRQVVSAGLADWARAKARYDALSEQMTNGASDKLLAEHAALAEQIEGLGGWDRGFVVEDILHKLGVHALDQPVGTMSGGERRRVALAAILVARPSLAILDEPTNHLDADTIEWLEQYLLDEYKGAVLMVTHDRYVLDAIADRIVELDHGSLAEYQGNYGDFLEQKAMRMAQAERVEANRLNFLRREVEWLRRGPKARTTKQKARIQRAESALAVEGPKTHEAVALTANAKGLGKTIIDFRAVTLEIGARRLVDALTLNMTAGQRIGIVGPNGVGKTTLLRAVAGELTPTAGEVFRGVQTKIAYFDQARAALHDDWCVFDNVAERHGALETGGIMVETPDATIPLRSYLERFLFDGAQQRQKVSALSGGERARVALAKSLKGGANVLLLDEPTNDLDTTTLAALEDLLVGWPGCALIVSHDRYFLNRVATGILAFTGKDGVVEFYQGNYDTYRSLKDEASKRDAPVARPKDKPAPVVAPAAAGPKPLTYAEKRELDGMLDLIAAAEDAAARADAVLADPELYVKRHAEVPQRERERDAAHTELNRLLARWEELESRKDAKR